MLELSTQTAHPVDVELARSHVEGLGVVPLAKSLTFDKAVQDLVHRDLGLEFLIARSDATDHMRCCRDLVIAVPVGLLNSSEVLEGTTARAVAKLVVLSVP